jgi:hypothetical protein
MHSHGSRATEQVTLRATGGLWTFATLCALTIFLFADSLTRGAIVFSLQTAPWALLILFVSYATLVRPCVVITPTELRLVNILRTHRLPWARIEDVTSRFQLRVCLDDGRRITSWGAPSVGLDRPSVRGAVEATDGRELAARASGVRRRQRIPIANPTSKLIIERARTQWQSDGEGFPPAGSPSVRPAATVQWAWRLIGSAAAITVWCAATAVVTYGFHH